MVALMKYECGMVFTGLVFETKELAEEFIKGTNPYTYEIIPVAYYTKEGKIL